MMPMGPAPGYNSYWNGMQPCMEGFMGPYGGPMQMMGYGLGPLDMPFAGGLPHDPFGMQGYMMPVVPPHRYVPFLIIKICLAYLDNYYFRKLNYCLGILLLSMAWG